MMQLPLRYPLTLSFKVIALAPQFSIRDANGSLVGYVKQKLFKLKEAVTVFADEQQTQPLYTLKADRIWDFSARYHLADSQGAALGSVKRHGVKSLWKAQYDILDDDRLVMSIHEENPWVKVLDALINEIPILGMFSGYLFHPAYLVSRPDGAIVMRMAKQPAFFEGKFAVDKLAPLSEREEKSVLLSLIMMLLLERTRG
jgi:uncharacterized protein YxjI